VSQRLCFGRFLSFMADSHKTESSSTLTEFRFRQHWKRTKGPEAERFAAVAHVLEHGIPQGYAALLDKPAVRKAVLDCVVSARHQAHYRRR
jgi:hypothetical protein